MFQDEMKQQPSAEKVDGAGGAAHKQGVKITKQGYNL